MTNLTNIREKLTKTWSKRSITRKFRLASSAQLLLIGTVALTGLFSLSVVRNKTESAMVTSIKIQRLVFDMNKNLAQARRKETEFFRQWSIIGFEKARQDYAEPHDKQILKVLQIRDELQKLLTSESASEGLRRSNPDLVEYEEKVRNYSDNFREAVGLVGMLGEDQTGVLARADRKSELLHDTLQLASETELIALYNQMQALEKEYLLKRSDMEKRSLSEAVIALREAIRRSQKLDTSQKEQAQRYLGGYELESKELTSLDSDIRKISDTFDEQTAAVSEKLLTVATEEVERARVQINLTSIGAAVLLGASAVATVVLALAIRNSFQSALEQLEIEQEKSERLLLNVLPKAIADRLKREPGTIADSFENVTVLFADIAGFTKLSSHISPTELVKLLNEIFSSFDFLAMQHGLEKIKTIGDAYMVVGGLPNPRKDHAEAIANMALDMQQAIVRFNEKHNDAFSIRIGINTGSVVAGVIGTKKFIYDLWGDTVNIASRMESHGVVGGIQIAEATYQYLRDKYWIEKRGLIEIKGKGEMVTYLIKGKISDRLITENQNVGISNSREDFPSIEK
ncbi:adenylate/guanylate cyclase domain-containing protein [Kamptonema sp. UHCC 0994]|uniref:adenylate/guanylate cyclase domain-containing protein n=1 Tax=Kamptonema sp. UHCC 0994 TaxID=3031329 RepID=UPI0023B95317|nr:adenylate/guanylate cyclase domain-containing protein [Kamptonema sp. UHCC 0994]MDF0551576.1 adenylate/guanylate cyclase domain-containing protein [Kamptonema sp. UHCC 0994]